MPAFEVHGYAIVSDDDRIADEGGETPDALRNDADWAYFQGELDRADLVVLGRLGHLANPNRRNRPRLVLSSGVTGIERRREAWWWNPAAVSWQDARAAVLPVGGRIAVPGGRRVFDLFLGIGYDAFHLSRAVGVVIAGGIPLFSACVGGWSAARVLGSGGLAPGGRRVLDPGVPVELTIWRRGSTAYAATVEPVER